MKKLRIEDLAVESFVTAPASPSLGTVHAYGTVLGVGACFGFDSVWDPGCDPYGATDEPNTCQGTCGDRGTCYGTCGIETCQCPPESQVATCECPSRGGC